MLVAAKAAAAVEEIGAGAGDRAGTGADADADTDKGADRSVVIAAAAVPACGSEVALEASASSVCRPASLVRRRADSTADSIRRERESSLAGLATKASAGGAAAPSALTTSGALELASVSFPPRRTNFCPMSRAGTEEFDTEKDEGEGGHSRVGGGDWLREASPERDST